MHPAVLSALVVVSITAILLCVGSKYVEYLGIMPVRRGSILAPYGELIEAKKLNEKNHSSKRAIFGKAVLSACSTAALAFLITFFSGAALQVPTLVVVSLVAACTVRNSLGFLRAFGYALAGALLVGGLLISLLAYVVFQLQQLDAFGLAGALGMLTGFTAAFGAAFGATFAPPVDRFERRFEDGHTDVILLSSRTKAYRRLEALASSAS